MYFTTERLDHFPPKVARHAFVHCHSSFMSTPIKKRPSSFREISSRSTKNFTAHQSLNTFPNGPIILHNPDLREAYNYKYNYKYIKLLLALPPITRRFFVPSLSVFTPGLRRSAWFVTIQIKSDFLKLSPPECRASFYLRVGILFWLSRLCFLANLVKPKFYGLPKLCSFR
eukprot:sb/3472184/